MTAKERAIYLKNIFTYEEGLDYAYNMMVAHRDINFSTELYWANVKEEYKKLFQT